MRNYPARVCRRRGSARAWTAAPRACPRLNGWTLEFNQVAVWVAKIQGEPVAFRAEVDFSGAGRPNLVQRQVLNDYLLIKWLDPQTQMIDISGHASGRRATCLA